MIKVSEVFTSICGEGINVGRPAVFLRTGGKCNINCSFCDTAIKDTYKKLQDKVITDLLYYAALGNKVKHLVITGGEPSLQAAQITTALTKSLLYCFRSIDIETNGLLGFDCWNELRKKCTKAGTVLYINCSPKFTEIDYSVQKKTEYYVFYKLIIKNVNTVKEQISLLAEKFNEILTDGFRCNRVFLQPLDNNLDIAKKLVEEGCFGCRLSLQIHKILEVQ